MARSRKSERKAETFDLCRCGRPSETSDSSNRSRVPKRTKFASGKATLSPAAYPLLEKISSLINIDRVHPVAVEGNTDNVPIHTGQFPSNWELSAARASTVVNFLISQGVSPKRLSAIGYAEQHPIASNSTSAGRARNRRVEIVLQRLYSDPEEAGAGEGQTTNTEG